MEDNWQHRTQTMRCQTCMWFVLKPAAGMLNPGSLGRCRRHAPTMSGYPAVFQTDWCGDHKTDETKLTPTEIGTVSGNIQLPIQPLTFR